jgi:hypothetical protein
MGIEPTNVGTTIRCVNHFATTAIMKLAGVVGIEPTPKVLETFVLPLNYTPNIAWWRGTESNRRHMDFQSIALPTELLSHYIYSSLNLNSATVRQKPLAFVAKHIPCGTMCFSTD